MPSYDVHPGARPLHVSMTRTPVSFPNRNGLRMFGIVERPDAPLDGVPAVVMLAPGSKMRVGPQRLYTQLSRQFVDLGYTVLRFDFHGLGDSEGQLDEAMLRDVYNHIEVGRFVNDTVDAMDWMQRELGASRFLLAGLCGGAVTGLLAGSRDARVAGLVGIGITPVLDSPDANPALYMTGGELSLIRNTYLRKLFNPAAWLRLLTFQSDFTLIWRSLTKPLRRATVAPPTAQTASAATSAPGDNSNPLFPPAFFAMADAHRPMLLVFGGADRLQWEFEEKFVARHRDRVSACRADVDVHVIAQANHTLTFPVWQDEMLATLRAWIGARFPVAATATPPVD